MVKERERGKIERISLEMMCLERVGLVRIGLERMLEVQRIERSYWVEECHRYANGVERHW